MQSHHAAPLGLVSAVPAIALSVVLIWTRSQALDDITLEIFKSDLEFCEAHPLDDIDVKANLVVNTLQRWPGVDVHYRGAYHLKELITQNLKAAQGQIGLRLWKVKVAPGSGLPKYRGYREWNFNYAPELDEWLSYYVFAASGHPTVPCRFVKFSVNGTSGLYLEYADADNRDWLREAFGNDEGDLYKAGGRPGQPGAMGEFTYLGDVDSCYYGHYAKITNNDSGDSLDYSSIRTFVKEINSVSDAAFENWLRTRMDVKNFTKYLVISNFISNWDAYPLRGKGCWLYEEPTTRKWTYIPWDLDRTWEPAGLDYCASIMGPWYDILFESRTYADDCLVFEDSRDRPLFTRYMAVPSFKNAYLQEYRRAVASYLSRSFLTKAADSVCNAIRSSLDNIDQQALDRAKARLDSYIRDRSTFVGTALAAYPADKTNYFPDPYPTLRITEILYHPANGWSGATPLSDTLLEFVEIHNVGTTPLDISGVSLAKGLSYTFPPGTLLGPGAYKVIASNKEAFRARYGKTPDGVYAGNLDNSGDVVALVDARKDEIVSVAYDDQSPWPATADGDGYSLVPTVPNPTGNQNSPSLWKRSMYMHGSPGADDGTSVARHASGGGSLAAQGLRVSNSGARDGAVRVTYRLDEGGHMRIDAFDVRGALVAPVAHGVVAPGAHTFVREGRGVGPGMRIYRLTGGVGAGFRAAVLSVK